MKNKNLENWIFAFVLIISFVLPMFIYMYYLNIKWMFILCIIYFILKVIGIIPHTSQIKYIYSCGDEITGNIMLAINNIENSANLVLIIKLIMLAFK